MKKNMFLIALTTFLLCFISIAYAAFNSELTISGDGLVEKDTVAPTCGSWYLRDSSLTIQEAYNQNKFKNPATNTTWTTENQSLFIECIDNMQGSYGCTNVTEITDNNNNKRYYKEVKVYNTSLQTDPAAISVTLTDAYQNQTTCSLPVGTVKPYLDKVAPVLTVTPTAYNKFTYSATDDMGVQGYMVTTSSTAPAIDDANWVVSPSEVTIDNTAAHTYYIWAKDGVNITYETINTYLLTRTEGTGTTLTINQDDSTGTVLTTGYVLDGTVIYVSGSVNQGYSNLEIRKNNVDINNPSTHSIDSNTTIESFSDFIGVTVTFNSNGGMVLPATKDVIPGETYGELPIPTKTGYAFRGWSLLPAGYRPVEYIESTGTQYIDTGVTANQDTGFDIKFKTNNSISSSSFGSIFGARQSSRINEYQLTTYSPDSSKKGVFRYGTNEYNADIANVSTIQTVSLRNQEYTGNTGVTYQVSGEFTTPVPLTIFALNQNGSITQNGKLLLYYLKIYDGDDLIRDFIPCKRNSDNAIGLCDLLSGSFYGNNGTGNFNYGHVIPVSYITSTSEVIYETNHTLYADWIIPDTPTKTYNYTGQVQKYTAPYTGYYKAELWGAQGGGDSTNPGGKGAYTSGVLELTEGETIYVYVGNYGYQPDNLIKPFNGGGAPDTTGSWSGSHTGNYSGGGASDIRLVSGAWDNATSLNSRIMVAAGGGGGNDSNGVPGGVGGTLTGGTCKDPSTGVAVTSPTQTTGYSFGTGQGSGKYNTDGGADTGAGGGGYYGGYRGTSTNTGGSGGSSYISGYQGCVAITSSSDRSPKSGCTGSSPSLECSYHYSNRIFKNPVMIAGDATMPSTSGSTETGHAGNGNAKITYLTEYTLTYNNAGGSGCTNKKGADTLTWGTLCTPTKEGKTFIEWNTAQDGTGSVVTSSTVVSGDLTVYAIWGSTVTIDPNGGTIGGNTNTYTVSQGQNTLLTIPKPKRDGYTFMGWTKTGGGSLTKYGKGLHKDDGFNSENNNINIYNNAGGGTVTHSKIATTGDNPMKNSPYIIRINTNGAASPGLGGFNQLAPSRANAVFYHVIVAKVPVGYYLHEAYNPIGSDASIEWITSNAGTGKYETYIYKANCGSSGTFSTLGFVYASSRADNIWSIPGGAQGETGTITWYVAYSNIFDYTAAPNAEDGQVFTFGDENTTLTANWDVTLNITATASTDWDITNYVDFTATSTTDGIVGYNITTTNTEPTTWIPVISTVESATETKYEYNAAWARVFHHNNHWGTTMYSDANSWAEAKSANTVDKYSVLGNLENYKFSNKWEFLLQYPDVSSSLYNRWTQTVNPVTTSIADSSSGTQVSGYSSVHTDWTGNHWGGLALSSTSSTFIDGDTGHSNWWYAIGVKDAYQGAMPGPASTLASSVNLWARIDGLSTTPSVSVSRRIGDLKSNTTYYVWVMDVNGNTLSKAVSVNRVDTTNPTASISSTNNLSSSQTATLTIKDNAAATRYYWGTSNPTTTNVSYTNITSTTSTTVSKTVSAAGTYYLAVQDAAGNRVSTNTTYYSISYNANGGSGAPGSQIYQYASSGTTNLSSTKPTRNGYFFLGWSQSSSATSASYSSGQAWNRSNASNYTLYAVWKKVDGTSKTFGYDSRCWAQTYVAPSAGTYLLEVCGAEGGSVSNSYGSQTGGKGGCASGKVSLSAGQTIYVLVGGKGGSALNGAGQISGGCNGGGATLGSGYINAATNYGAGGGATHIGKTNATLANTSVSNLYIAAGGGGGGNMYTASDGYTTSWWFGGNGGNGGSASGGNGTCSARDGTCYGYGRGGTQSAGGSYGGSYGQGGPTGGGGYYGGGRTQTGGGIGDNPSAGGGGGGSGYVGGVSSASWSSSSCQNYGNGRSGDGCAKITKQ